MSRIQTVGAVWLLACSLALGQTTGIKFTTQGNLRTVFDQAKTERKAVFLEVFSPTCQTCTAFKPTLADARVGTAYNARLVSYQLDVQSPEAQAFLSKQGINVPALPLFLFFDSNVKLLYAGQPENNPTDVAAQASRALNPNQRSTSYAGRFRRGERGPAFLYAYAQFTRIKPDTVANIDVVRAYAKTIRRGEQTSERNFRLIQKTMLDPENDLFRYFLNNLPEYQRRYDRKAVQEAGETVVMSTLFSSRGAKLAPEQIQTLAGYLRKLGLEAGTVANRTLLPELRAFANARQFDKLAARADSYLVQSGSGPAEYTYLARFLTQRSSLPAHLNTAVRWLKVAEAKAAKDAALRSDAQYELAEAYLKLNQKADARRTAQLALTSAKAARKNTKRFEELLAKTS
jgi:hypothetical protein